MAQSRIIQLGAIEGQISTSSELSGQINQVPELKGVINAELNLKGMISSNNFLVGTINSIQQIIGKIDIPLSDNRDISEYEGDYVVTPKVASQTLSTKEKLLHEDILILEIPYYETSNESGKTIYIGGE